jgi:FKBP-type peptidyl-prolyl cis-trans isomerase FkpA
MLHVRLFAVVIALAASCAGCSPTAPTVTTAAPFSQSDIVVGSGAVAANGSALTVSYTGWLFDSAQPNAQGAQFDSSTAFSFALGQGQVIPGWDQGLVGMKVGGKRRLVIPPSLAYGDTRHGVIPPNATLLFEVTLTAVQ